MRSGAEWDLLAQISILQNNKKQSIGIRKNLISDAIRVKYNNILNSSI